MSTPGAVAASDRDHVPAKQRGLLRLCTAADLEQAERTVPRGRGRHDEDPAPSVPMWLWTLHVRQARERDARILDALVREYHAYALMCARRLHRQGEAFDDLSQVACEALVGALNRFEPARGYPFPAFATPTINGALKRHYRDRGWAMRVPRRAHELVQPIGTATDELTAQLGRPPTVQQLAHRIGISVEELIEAQEALHARRLASFESANGEGTIEPGCTDEDLRLVVDRVALRAALRTLGERERTIVGLYYFRGLSQTEIAARFGVSQMQVSRWLANTLAHLETQLS